MSSVITMIGSIFLLIGATISAVFIYKILKARSSVRWKRANGELLSSELRTVVFTGIRESATRDSAKAWVTDFRYKYTVENKEYTGSRVTFSDFVNKSGGSLKKLQQKYHGKNAIAVYYNPKNPAESVLIPGASLYNFTPLLTCFGFIAVGAYLMML